MSVIHANSHANSVCQWLYEAKTQNETELRRRDNNEVTVTITSIIAITIDLCPSPHFATAHISLTEGNTA